METLLAPALPTETLASTKRLTTEEFRTLDFEDESFFYELLHGELVKRSAPSLAHQRITKIFFALLTLLL